MLCANRSNSTNLARIDGGLVVKQGDLASSFGFELLDENKDPIPSLDGQEAKITLTKDGEQWKHTSTVTNGSVVFNLDGILPEGTYNLEICVAGYVFPSDDSTQIRITKSDKNLVTEEIHALKELDIEKEVKKQLAERPASEGGACQEIPDLLFYYNLGKV